MRKTASASVLMSADVDKLTAIIEEATRSTQDGVRFFIEPAQGTLSSALSRRHHLIFGRRGSGKSSLLNKVAEEAGNRGNPVVFVDMEAFKAHSYPDVLVSVLITTFSGFLAWAKEDEAKRNKGVRKKAAKLWSILISRSKTPTIADQLGDIVEDLKSRLHSEEEVSRTARRANQKDSGSKVTTGADLKVKSKKLDLGAQSQIESDERRVTEDEVIDTYSHRKIEFLHRSIIDYSNVLREVSKVVVAATFSSTIFIIYEILIRR